MTEGSKSKIRARLRELSLDNGFDDFGISKADFLEEEAPRLEDWLNQGFHGKMNYMENWFDMRLDPRKILDGAKSVISFTYNYFPKEQQRRDTYQIAKYAYGKDYHFVVKKKLKNIAFTLAEEYGDFAWRAFVDSGPMLDRVWAKKSGLGWVGKNSLLLNKDRGSFFFIGHLITDLNLNVDNPVTDHCGTCTKCMDACPTDAIPEPYKVDGSKCISYFTIELKDSIPNDFYGKYQDWIFGCDICQDVCPWTSKSIPHQEPDFEISGNWREFSKSDWECLSEEQFKLEFKKSALKRAGYQGLKRNVSFLSEEKDPSEN